MDDETWERAVAAEFLRATAAVKAREEAAEEEQDV
jgi:hypothetical protein